VGVLSCTYLIGIHRNSETEGKPTEDEIGVSMDTNQICTGENAHNTTGIAQIDYDDSSECKSKVKLS
jgi:hypothetical protein